MKLLSMLCLSSALALAADGPRIATSQYDNMRSGANVDERVLTPRNVNPRSFGKIRSLPVDGDVYAQPLYLPAVTIPGKGVRNLLFVATEHNSVYAFDTDTMLPVWKANLLPSGGLVTPVPDRDVQCPFISPEVGITATPVIDTETGTLYVLARGKNWRAGSNGHYSQKLHALAITTGAEKFGGPVEIRASMPGTGAGSSGGVIEFDPLRENPRASLLLVNGVVYLSWASSCDVGPYHGWVMAYDARTLKQRAVLNTSPGAAESGIWQSDTGPAADRQGHVYLVTGNGDFDAGSAKGRDYGDTILRLSLRGNELAVDDYFTPFDQQQLSSTDGDLGSGGPLLLPGASGARPDGVVFGGKAGVLYMVNPERMGKQQRDASDPSAEKIKLSDGIYSAPAYWNGHLYYYAGSDAVKDFVVRNGKLASTPESESAQKSQFSGGTPTVSANGTTNGVVWTIETKAWNASGGEAILRAYDALNVSKELYASDRQPNRDRAGGAIRFTIPTVAGGRVYVGVKKGVAVYGVMPH